MENIWQHQSTYIWLAIIAALIIWSIIRSLNRIPKWLNAVILYLNMKPVDISEATINYSKFLSNWPAINWNFVYAGKEKGQDIMLGNFSVEGRYFYFFSYKTTVQPMIITNTEGKFDYPLEEKVLYGDATFHIYSKEKFLMEKIKRSDDFLPSLSRIFPGRNNWLEFTDLNQVILVTDYDFNDHQKMLQLMADFVQIKEKL